MHAISYNKEILTAQAEIIRIFSNITITPNRSNKKFIVPCRFAQTSRVLKSIMNPTGAPQIYPLITIERGSITADLKRNEEIHHDMASLCNSSKYDPNTKPPTPIDIEFTVHIFSKYPSDSDMIVSNFIPFFNKDVFVKCPHPKIDGKTLSHQIVWDGTVTYDWKSTLQSTEQDIQIASTKFTYKTYMFGGTEKLKDTKDGIIYTINMDLTPAGDGNIYPTFDYDNPDNNVFSGFYCVPYGDDFNTYADTIVERYLNDNAAFDGFIINGFNEQFNSAIMNQDMPSLSAAYENGADIFKHSYWCYTKAANEKWYDGMIWLAEHEALGAPDKNDIVVPDSDNTSENEGN